MTSLPLCVTLTGLALLVGNAGDDVAGEYPGAPRFESGVVRRRPVDVDLDVTGARTLYLVAEDAGDGREQDWIDWLEGVLEGPQGPVSLEELGWVRSWTGEGTLQVGRNGRGGPLRAAGVTYQKGIGARANCGLVFDLTGKGFTRLRLRCAVDEIGSASEWSRCSVRFRVYHDGPTETQRARALSSVMLDDEADLSVRRDAARDLARLSAGGRKLLALARQGRLPKDLHDVVATHIYSNPDLGVRALASEHFPRKRPDGRVLPSVQAILDMESSAERGRELFFSDKASCYRCHSVGREGGSVGPDLSDAGLRLKSLEILDSILNPSATIVAGFESWTLETDDGVYHVGHVLSDSEVVTLRDSQGLIEKIPRDEIVQRQRHSLSVMPSDVALGLEVQELTDLVDFLSGLE